MANTFQEVIKGQRFWQISIDDRSQEGIFIICEWGMVGSLKTSTSALKVQKTLACSTDLGQANNDALSLWNEKVALAYKPKDAPLA
jgi:hypothetical protein